MHYCGLVLEHMECMYWSQGEDKILDLFDDISAKTGFQDMNYDLKINIILSILSCNGMYHLVTQTNKSMGAMKTPQKTEREIILNIKSYLVPYI